MRSRRLLLKFGAACLGLALAGCGGLLESKRPSVHSWWLEPLAAPAAAPDAHQPPLTVRLDVVPGLDTDRILTLGPDARLNHYAGARWSDNLPELLESLVVRSLQGSGRHAEVAARHGPVTNACHLDLTAERFYSRLDGNGQTRSVEIRFAGRYACDAGERAVTASQSVPVTGNRMPEVVAAYQAGFDQAMRSLLGALED